MSEQFMTKRTDLLRRIEDTRQSLLALIGELAEHEATEKEHGFPKRSPICADVFAVTVHDIQKIARENRLHWVVR